MKMVLFDAVGTLITPSPPVAEAYHAAGRRFGSSLTPDSIRARFRNAFGRQEAYDASAPISHRTSEERERQRWRTIVAEVFDDVADAEGLFQTLWEHFAQPQHWRVYDDVADCFLRLREAGHEIGIASNFDGRLDALCDRLAPLADCRLRFVSSRLGHKKPSPQFFREIEQALHLPPSEIILVGDDLENDYLAAGRAGWQAVLLARSGIESLDLTSGPIITTLAELPGMLSCKNSSV